MLYKLLNLSSNLIINEEICTYIRLISSNNRSSDKKQMEKKQYKDRIPNSNFDCDFAPGGINAIYLFL